MSEGQERPEEPGSVGQPGSGGAAGEPGSVGQPGSGGAAGQPGSSSAARETGGAGRGHHKAGRAEPGATRAAPDIKQELRDRGRELREIGRERVRELGELATAQREVKREREKELRELARAGRAIARGLGGNGRRGTGVGSSDGDGRTAGDEKSTRERVLDVALDMFIEQGYDKASLREIAERMGFTKAALYYHFPSKADMLLALHQRMHNLIDEPVSLLGDGTVTVAMWEKFLDACINAVQNNEKLFQMHRINQAAMSGVHSEGHEGAHQELEEQAMRIFSEPSLRPEDRLRMAAAFAVSFFTPFIASGLFSNTGDDFLPNGLREIVHRVLQPEVAKRDEETKAAADKRDR